MRDRLIELLSDAEREHLNYEMANKFCPFDGYKCHSEYIADYLLENGVVVFRCKVGDDIYRIGDNGKIYGDWQILYIQKYQDEIVYIDDSNNYFLESEIGKTVFLTREEAERALRKDEGK